MTDGDGPNQPPGGGGKRLDGKRCLVTGGSRGLGRAIALAFASHGARVAFTFHSDRGDAEAARDSLARRGCEALVFQGSVADAAHVKATVAEVIATRAPGRARWRSRARASRR